jgi:hypothetical protein
MKKMRKTLPKKISITEVIELGLNIIAQDLIFKKHTQEEIDNYINRFKFNNLKSETRYKRFIK